MHTYWSIVNTINTVESLWPQDFGFFQYLRYKAWFTFCRWLSILLDPFKFQNEARLVPPEVRRDRGLAVVGVEHEDARVAGQPGAAVPARGEVQVSRDGPARIARRDLHPEHPFPAAPHDAEDALRWVAGQPGLFDLGRVVVAGFSAGGCLALPMAAASPALRKKELVGAPLAIAVYPMTDVSFPSAARTVPRPIRPIHPRFLEVICDAYCPRDFPPRTAIVTAEGDTLRPEADALARKLTGAGRDVFYHMVEGAAHGFDKSLQEWDGRPSGRT
ncbi:GTPase-activating protein [Pestalotiopsis sp. IQ-011]